MEQRKGGWLKNFSALVACGQSVTVHCLVWTFWGHRSTAPSPSPTILRPYLHTSGPEPAEVILDAIHIWLSLTYRVTNRAYGEERANTESPKPRLSWVTAKSMARGNMSDLLLEQSIALAHGRTPLGRTWGSRVLWHVGSNECRQCSTDACSP